MFEDESGVVHARVLEFVEDLLAVGGIERGHAGVKRAGSGFVLAAGIVGLKALALHNILEAQSRKKRAAEETDLAFVPIAVSEPEACYKRFICDLATGSLPKSENDVILSLFNKPTSSDSPKFAFSQAATLGNFIMRAVPVVSGSGVDVGVLC